MVDRGRRAMAMAQVAWTLLEIVSAVVLCLLLGPSGLAWSYATVIWGGLVILARPLPIDLGQLIGGSARPSSAGRAWRSRSSSRAC